MAFIPVLQLFLFVIFLAAFFHSIKNIGPSKTIRFLAVVLIVGFTLEYIASATGFIVGSRFTHNLGGFSVGPIPVLILTSWWVILYGVMALTNHFFAKKQPLFKLIFFDTLFAVSFDLAADPIATLLGIWQWDRPGIFFGVPVGNFFGWIIVVSVISLIVRSFIFKTKS